MVPATCKIECLPRQSITHRVSMAEHLPITDVQVDITVRNFQSVHNLADVDVRNTRLGVGVRVLADVVAIGMLGHVRSHEGVSDVMGVGVGESIDQRR